MYHSEKELDRALTLIHMARAFSYPGRVVPENGKAITGKWYARKRREILAFARTAAPEGYAAYLAARKLPASERIKAYQSDSEPQTEGP